MPRGSDLPQDNSLKSDTSLHDAVFHAIGRGSACWSNLDGAGEFQNEEAKKIGNDLVAWVESWYEERKP